MTLQLVTPGDPLPEEGKPDFRDIVGCLRRIADNLEGNNAHYGGEAIRVALVIRCADVAPVVAGFGEVPHLSQVYMDLHAGAEELMSMHAPERV